LITIISPSTSVDIDKSNGLLVLTNEGVEDIEMKPLNHTSTTPAIPTNTQSSLMPPDCFPRTVSKYFDCCEPIIPKSIQRYYTQLRSKAHRLVEHRFFEWLIIASILASSTTLVSRNNHQ
jgi:hypothetical protein